MWQDGEDIFKGYYDEAVKYCENLSFSGFDDWRLPMINELISIMDKRKFAPAINSAFKNIVNYAFNFYWSSTRSAAISSYAWVVRFRAGGYNWDSVYFRFFVRCVRND